MELALLLNTHENSSVLEDTIESVKKYVTNDILVIADGCSWNQFNNFNSANLLCGFKHGCEKSPYRNVALGLKMLEEKWPNADWYVYCEYDVLFASDRFKKNLKIADEMDVWMLGSNGHVDDRPMPLIQSMFKETFKSYYYLLGCCQFFNKKFMKKLVEIDFFDRLLNATNQFTDGYIPGYSGYDISENIYPTICRHFGGNIGVFSTYDEMGKWHGYYRNFPIRWRPEIQDEDNYPESSILHPVKNMGSVRKFHKKKRDEE